MLLVHSFVDNNKLTKCPDTFVPDYIIDKIEIKKSFLSKKTYVTIERI